MREMDWAPRLERIRQKQGKLKKDIVKLVSLDTELPDSRRQAAMAELLEGKEPPPDQRIDRLWTLRKLLKGLNKIERLVVIGYYYENKTMAEISGDLAVSPSRVSQIHESIIKRMREKQSMLLELEPEDSKRYREVRDRLERRLSEGKLPITRKGSFVGYDVIPNTFPASFKQSKLKQKKRKDETAVSFYTVHSAAQQWGLTWQMVASLKRSGLIPKEAITSNNMLDAGFVDTANVEDLIEKYKKVKSQRLHDQRRRRSKKIREITETEPRQETITTATPVTTTPVTTALVTTVVPVPQVAPRHKKYSLLNTQAAAFLKELIGATDSGDRQVINWSVKVRGDVEVVTIELRDQS
jgi:hypothetical protein